MGARCPEDEPEFLLESLNHLSVPSFTCRSPVVREDLRSRPEQQDHDQRMWKPDLGAIHGTIAGALDDGEEVMVSWVEEDALNGGLAIHTRLSVLPSTKSHATTIPATVCVFSP